MNKFEKIYLKILFEANWDFGQEYIKKGEYKNIGIYFQQNHIIQRIKERGNCTLGQLLTSCKRLIKIMQKRDQLTTINEFPQHLNVFDKSLNIFYGIDLIRKKHKDIFLKVNTFLDNNWKQQYRIYEI